MLMRYTSNISRNEGDPKIISVGPSALGLPDRLAKALGWFGIGLGLIELLAPGRITRALGMEGRERLVRAYGGREIASGVLTLSIDKRAGLWSRVAGDGLDMATLLTALRGRNRQRSNVETALLMVLGIGVLDLIAVRTLASPAPRRKCRDGARLYSDRSGFANGPEAARGIARRSAAPGAPATA